MGEVRDQTSLVRTSCQCYGDFDCFLTEVRFDDINLVPLSAVITYLIHPSG